MVGLDVIPRISPRSIMAFSSPFSNCLRWILSSQRDCPREVSFWIGFIFILPEFYYVRIYNTKNSNSHPVIMKSIRRFPSYVSFPPALPTFLRPDPHRYSAHSKMPLLMQRPVRVPPLVHPGKVDSCRHGKRLARQNRCHGQSM